MKRAALYARISTHEGKQFTENQLAEMRQYCKLHNLEVVKVYLDEFTGTSGDRAGLKALLNDAYRHRFDVVLVWALDRFTAEGVFQAFGYIERLKSSKVEFISVTEPLFGTAGPFGELFLALSAWMAKQERVRLRERIRAGLSRAREKGTRLGRPVAVLVDARKITSLRKEGKTGREVAETLGCSKATMYRRLKNAET
jgi:DNA invertase Pin-like site-specific DNA recombinase